MTRLGPLWLPIWHVEAPTPKHVENSIHGLNRAVVRGDDSADLDWQHTRPDPSCRLCRQLGRVCIGHAVCTHWPRPLLRDGFRDPTGKLGRMARVADMTLPEVRRLKTRDGYVIHDAPRMFREAAERDMRVLAEVKAGAFADHEVMRRFVADARNAGARMRVMKLSDGAKPLATLKAAKAAGADTVLIARAKVPDSWRPFVDYERGPARFWR